MLSVDGVGLVRLRVLSAASLAQRAIAQQPMRDRTLELEQGFWGLEHLLATVLAERASTLSSQGSLGSAIEQIGEDASGRSIEDDPLVDVDVLEDLAERRRDALLANAQARLLLQLRPLLRPIFEGVVVTRSVFILLGPLRPLNEAALIRENCRFEFGLLRFLLLGRLTLVNLLLRPLLRLLAHLDEVDQVVALNMVVLPLFLAFT